jgi:hypothetical protein
MTELSKDDVAKPRHLNKRSENVGRFLRNALACSHIYKMMGSFIFAVLPVLFAPPAALLPFG